MSNICLWEGVYIHNVSDTSYILALVTLEITFSTPSISPKALGA